MSELTFEQMLEESFKTIRNGEVVDGTVIDVKTDEIILNIGYKACLLYTSADPTNFLLMHAMGPNVAGVIGTAVAAGTFMAIFGVM